MREGKEYLERRGRRRVGEGREKERGCWWLCVGSLQSKEFNFNSKECLYSHLDN